MKKNIVGIIGALAMLALAVINPMIVNAVVIEVTPWSAPNAFGSPSYDAAVANAIYAQKHGLSSYGNPALPTYYTKAPAVMNISDNIVTGFPSWHGQADPGTVFGPAFAAELGNRLSFGLLVWGEGSKIAIGDLGFSATSTDPFNTLSFAFAAGSYNYSMQYQGWNFGGDNLPNTGDDSFITSGPNTQLADALVGRGSGNAWPIYLSDPGATPQDKIDNAQALFELGDAPFTFTGKYTIGATEGSATVTFGRSVPDNGPTLSLLAGVGMVGLVFRRKIEAMTA